VKVHSWGVGTWEIIVDASEHWGFRLQVNCELPRSIALHCTCGDFFKQQAEEMSPALSEMGDGVSGPRLHEARRCEAKNTTHLMSVAAYQGSYVQLPEHEPYAFAARQTHKHAPYIKMKMKQPRFEVAAASRLERRTMLPGAVLYIYIYRNVYMFWKLLVLVYG
jgi:hypothetical protein